MGYQKSPSLSNNTYKKNGRARGPGSFAGSQSLSNNNYKKNVVIVASMSSRGHGVSKIKGSVGGSGGFRGYVTVSKDDIVVLDGAGDKKAIKERCEQADLKAAQQTKDGRDVKVSNLRAELENVKDETLGAMVQLKESESEAKALRTMTHRMILTHEDMVSVVDCIEKDYTVITLQCNDRPKLLFDIACTITEMKYVVYHGVVHAEQMEANREHDRVMLCLEAAIERRTFEQIRNPMSSDSASTNKLKIRTSTGENGSSLVDATMLPVKSVADDLNLMKSGQVNSFVSSTY
nr:ACT domain-containing protein [Tanacetum cinerariifolium]